MYDFKKLGVKSFYYGKGPERSSIWKCRRSNL